MATPEVVQLGRINGVAREEATPQREPARELRAAWREWDQRCGCTCPECVKFSHFLFTLLGRDDP